MVITFCFTLCAIIYLRPIAIHIGLIDLPTARKHHDGQVPLIGGIAMLFGMAIGILVLDISLAPYRILFAAIAIISFFNVLDDFHELSHRTRFIIQFFVAFIIAYFGHDAINNLGNFIFLHEIHLGLLNLPFTIIAIVAVINAVNMSDGVDGLAGTLALLQFFSLLILAWHVARYSDCFLMLISIAAILAFLYFNFPWRKQHKRRVFMGDVGSALIGTLLAWFLISLSQAAVPAANPVTFLWIMAIPFFDLISVMYRRMRNKRSPFHADREHLHHILRRSGLSVLTTVLVISCVALLFAIAGIVMNFLHVSESIMFVILACCFVGYIFLVNHINWVTAKFSFLRRRIVDEQIYKENS
jgi:UDP-GlcNAc:undecaprenyl-phosphate GlcNAc-1-phosphate transferase